MHQRRLAQEVLDIVRTKEGLVVIGAAGIRDIEESRGIVVGERGRVSKAWHRV